MLPLPPHTSLLHVARMWCDAAIQRLSYESMNRHLGGGGGSGGLGGRVRDTPLDCELPKGEKTSSQEKGLCSAPPVKAPRHLSTMPTCKPAELKGDDEDLLA